MFNGRGNDAWVILCTILIMCQVGMIVCLIFAISNMYAPNIRAFSSNSRTVLSTPVKGSADETTDHVP